MRLILSWIIFDPKWIKTIHLFSYASMFWSIHVREANNLDDIYIASIKTSSPQFFDPSTLANWFSSIVACRSLIWMDGPHLLSVPAGVQNAATWLVSRNVGVIATKPTIQLAVSAHLLRVPAAQHTDTQALSPWGSQIAAELWVTEDPRDTQASMARFTIARRLNQQARRAEDDISEPSISLSVVDLLMIANADHSGLCGSPTLLDMLIRVMSSRALRYCNQSQAPPCIKQRIARFLYFFSDTLSTLLP
jgi:hypothetical protein